MSAENHMNEMLRIAKENGYYDGRVYTDDDGAEMVVAIMPLVFTHAIICDIDHAGYGDRWCYHSYIAAKMALDAWDGCGEPIGWHRHPKSGRRRDEQGNETINY